MSNVLDPKVGFEAVNSCIFIQEKDKNLFFWSSPLSKQHFAFFSSDFDKHIYIFGDCFFEDCI